MFGLLLGSTVTNLVLDESCMVYNTVNDNNLIMRIGGIAGVISGSNDAVRVKNCVVMSTIIQFGNSSQTYIGGIAGFATNDDYGAEIKNCAYIGTSGTIETHNIIVFGGIVGFGTGVVIKNNIFNGQFLDESDYGTFLYIGGIIGYKNGEIEVDNCVAIENYMTSNGCSYNRIIGNGNDMVGNNFWSGYIRFSGNNDGYEFYKNLTTEELSLDYYKGNSLIEALNAYCTEYPHLELSQWIGNKELFNLTFNINGEETITIDSPVVLTQSLADVPPYLFDGWYEDINKEVLFKEGEITSDTTLYATYKTDDTHASTITFYSDEEEVFSAIVRYGNTVEFPTNVTKKGYILIGWLYKDGSQVSIPFVMPSYNISLYARWAICQIFSADDFKVFTENVNAHGYSYEGLTVSLEEDIVFSTNETQTSVSTEGTFLGTFDGKGHVISNFIIEEKVYNIVGLFRILYEGTIKDVIMDGTCSVSSAFTTTEYNVFVGSILGVGISSIGMVSVTNCVNMGSVGYKGECQYNSTIIGGIAGSIQLDQYNFMVSKCTNYGSVLMSGTSNKLFMGGIVGSALGEQDIPYVVSCLNNGLVRDVSYDGDKRIGGIIGYSYFVSVIGCVSFGEVITDNAGAEDFVHPVIGDGIQNYISNNFYYEGMGCTDQTKSTSFDDNYFESGGSDIVGILNGLGTEYGKWSIATFVCNGGELYVHAEWRRRRRRGDGGGDEDGKYAVIRGHIPPIMKSERRFAGWFQDEHFEGEPVNGTNLADRVTLYAGYGHRLIYDPNGGTIGKNNYTRTLVECNDIIKYYPSVAINCKALSRWEPKNDTLIVKTGEGSDTTLSYSSSSSFSSSEKYYVMPDRNVTLMAVWTQVMYTITFNNSELEPTQIPCSGTFNPEDYVPPGRQGYIFDGWYIDQMFTMKVPRLPCVSSDYIIYAKWEFNGTALSSSSQSASGYNASKNSSSSSSSSNNNGRYDANKDEGTNVGVIVGPIVGVLVVIIIVIVIVFILIVKRRHNDNDDDDDDDNEGYVDERRNLELDERRKGKGEEDADRGSRGDRERDYDMYTRVVSKAGAEEGENNNNNISSSSNGKLIKSLNSQYNLYPEYYHIPSIEEALMEAGLGEKRAKKVAATCYEKAEKVMQNLPGELTKDDAAALAMYTFDFGAKHYESNPFRLINKGLVGGTTESLTRIRGLLYLVTTALRKLPRVTGRTLYRGVRKDANIDQKCYNDGVIVTWNAFSSTSPDMNATKAFLAKGSEDGKAAGTLFIIEKGWGYDIQPYSLFPDEAEILLEPERQFKVTSVLSSELVVITLEMIETPLVLPQIFGGPDN